MMNYSDKARLLAAAGPSTITANKSTDKSAEVYLTGFVGSEWNGITSKQVTDTLNGLGRVSNLTFYLNSPGGDTSEGFAIYNAIVRHNTPRKRIVADNAVSIAGVILQAGTERVVYDTTWVMLHEVHAVNVTGTVSELEQIVNRMKTIGSHIQQVYANRSGQSLVDIKQMMADETWLSGQAIVDKGFADKVISPNGQVANSFDVYDVVKGLYSRPPVKPIERPNLAKFVAKHGLLFPIGGK